MYSQIITNNLSGRFCPVLHTRKPDLQTQAGFHVSMAKKSDLVAQTGLNDLNGVLQHFCLIGTFALNTIHIATKKSRTLRIRLEEAATYSPT